MRTTTSTQPAEVSTTATPITTTSTLPDSTASTGSEPLSPEGPGCTPETATLPDGEWYGGVRGFDGQGLSFDLACLFISDAATAAAAEDGEESPPPNDYYVRNESEAVRMLTVAPYTLVTWYTSGDPNDEVTGTYGMDRVPRHPGVVSRHLGDRREQPGDRDRRVVGAVGR